MNEYRAAEVLNVFRHRGIGRWEVMANNFGETTRILAIDGLTSKKAFIELTPFEAIAIAEKYERESS